MKKEIIKTGIYVSSALCLAACGKNTSQTSATEKSKLKSPNIVLIYTDDLDFDQMNVPVYPKEKMPCYTGAHLAGKVSDYDYPEGWDPLYFHPDSVYTPNMKKLAQEGAYFSNFYITSAMCTPSRYSLLTGKYAHNSPAVTNKFPSNVPAEIEWNQWMTGEHTNIAKQLKQAGYYTGIVGKWHNGEPEEAKTREVFHKYKKDSLLLQQKMKEGQIIGSKFLTEKIGFDFAQHISYDNADNEGGHNLPWYSEAVLEFLDKDHEKPFFLYFPAPVPHGFGGGSEFHVDLNLSPEGYLEKVPDSQPPIDDVYRRIRENGYSDRSVSHTWLDDALGVILQKLEEKGIANNTIVIFTSDHQSRGKFSCYEGAHVACMMRWPGVIEPGTKIDDIWANIDVMPTLLDIAGYPAPIDLDGKSFYNRVIKNSEPDYNRTLLLETGHTKAVVKGKYKYIANRTTEEIFERMKKDSVIAGNNKDRTIGWDGYQNMGDYGMGGVRFNNNQFFNHYFDADQLYNLEKDVFEQTNLIKEEPEKLEEMKDELKKLLVDCPNVFGEFTE